MGTELLSKRSNEWSSFFLVAFVASFLTSVLSVTFVQALKAQVPPGQLGYQDTPMQPNGKWHIHDGKRPQPDIVTPNGPVTTPPMSSLSIGTAGGAC